jgi:hypothetical protein
MIVFPNLNAISALITSITDYTSSGIKAGAELQGKGSKG